MGKINQKPFLTVRPLMLAILIFTSLVNCGDGARERPDDGSGQNLSTADATLAASVGAGDQVVLEDSYLIALTMANNLSTVISVATGTINDNESGNNNTFGATQNALSDANDTNDTVVDFEVADLFDEYRFFSYDNGVDSINCDLGGSRQIDGVLTLTLSSGGNNSITGDYAVTYDSCIEIVTLSTSDGSCLTQVQIDGTITSSTNLSFTGTPNTTDNFTNYIIDNDLSTEINGMGYAVGYYPGGTLGATSFVTYNYNLERDGSFPNESFTGTLSSGDDVYDITDVASFIASAASTAVCPAAPTP